MRRTLIFTATMLTVTHSAATMSGSNIESATLTDCCPTCPTLIVWTSRTCLPCRTFWRDVREDATFREALTNRFCIRWIDADLHYAAANRQGIDSLPTFEIEGRHVIGYDGKQRLWDRLAQQNANGWRASTPTDGPPEPIVDRESERRVDTRTPPPRLERSIHTPSLNTLEDDVHRVIEPLVSETPQTVSPVLHASRVEASNTARRPTASSSTRPSLWSRLRETITRTAPLALTALELTGILTGTAATGGLGMFAMTVLWKVWSRRWRRRSGTASELTLQTDERDEEGEQWVSTRAPFPRELDEARELLALRQSEGRVAVLDALRGMFLDDELTKLTTVGNDTEAAVARRLQTNINTRVDEVAPLSTTHDS